MKKLTTGFAMMTALAFSVGHAGADVKMPAIFGDHMVLQEGMKLPVWGTAAPGENITVQVGSETATATAGSDGKWTASLAPLAEGKDPVTVTVTGKNTLKFTDVLVGDVWLCSGQSNMQYSLGAAHNVKTELPKADDPQLRLFIVRNKSAVDPETDVSGMWWVTTPKTAGGFSAVGYFFGEELRKTLQRPIGLIGSYVGGTPAQAWTSLSGLEKDPELKHYVDAAEKLRADYPQALAAYPAQMAAFKAEMDKWNAQYGAAYNASTKEWQQAAAQAISTGQPPPKRPQPPVPQPKPPMPPVGNSPPTGLFNGMIAPLIPYALKGVIWYQGESNTSLPVEYRTLFARMIKDWRERWNEGDFPFLFVELAGYTPGGWNWCLLRESQTETLDLPNTGMASAVDIGAGGNIHPMDKIDVGLRLALVAKHVAYGQDVVYSGPVFDKMQAEGSTIRISYKNIGGGLVIGDAPWVAPGAKPIPDTTLVGFSLAGDDKKWVPANAKIDGNNVIVSSDQVPHPVAVRYAWESSPVANLYNKEMLPAEPFRTDDWPK